MGNLPNMCDQTHLCSCLTGFARRSFAGRRGHRGWIAKRIAAAAQNWRPPEVRTFCTSAGYDTSIDTSILVHLYMLDWVHTY